ncbi:unnamed protein product [Prorocentrum cordatum]|uniref:Uncharacterized protein n=1 Tax=Prorocentrum cordatum TaxID=2364126 RepID=A0ABN9PI89_9DINO|nr:unnamed protein product [Polarella glacialis]
MGGASGAEVARTEEDEKVERAEEPAEASAVLHADLVVEVAVVVDDVVDDAGHELVLLQEPLEAGLLHKLQALGAALRACRDPPQPPPSRAPRRLPTQCCAARPRLARRGRRRTRSPAPPLVEGTSTSWAQTRRASRGASARRRP